MSRGAFRVSKKLNNSGWSGRFLLNVYKKNIMLALILKRRWFSIIFTVLAAEVTSTISTFDANNLATIVTSVSNCMLVRLKLMLSETGRY